jgi:hypothetical protein
VLIGPRASNPEKLQPFECGSEPIGNAPLLGGSTKRNLPGFDIERAVHTQGDPL